MRNRYIILFLFFMIPFLGCEKEKDPRFRIKNDLDFDNYFQIRQYQGASSSVLSDSIYIDTETITDYRNVGVGSYLVTTLEDPIVPVPFKAEKNKTYTIEFYVNANQISLGRVVQP
jgi:hypothetical protein